ncbi:hypothetical protein B0J14DRAFT_149242 [Halenospora varia]|nr:hypothetical protein B0J14DRAFT_149242 [Halenospora varia]
MIEEEESRKLVLRNHAAATARERETRQRELLAVLSDINHQYKHNRMQSIRYEGTGKWLTTLPQYCAWSKLDTLAALFCYGIRMLQIKLRKLLKFITDYYLTGSGKSVRISSMIDGHILQQSAVGNTKTLFYYFDYSDKRTLDPISLFGTLSQQLLRHMGDFPEAFLQMLESIYQKKTK